MAVATFTSEELVSELANGVKLEPSKFSSIGAYEEPLRYDGIVQTDFREYVNRNGVIVRLNLPQQFMLYQLLSKQHGLQLRHGGLGEQLKAAYSPEGQNYKRNVLGPYWVFTGEMRRQSDNEFGRLVRVEPIAKPSPTVVFDDEETSPTNASDYKFVLSRGGVHIPTRTGNFDRIGETKGKGYWNGVSPDNQGRSAVGCYWNSGERGLFAVAGRPLYRYYGGALGTWKSPA